jgi:hypothetical protein
MRELRRPKIIYIVWLSVFNMRMIAIILEQLYFKISNCHSFYPLLLHLMKSGFWHSSDITQHLIQLNTVNNFYYVTVNTVSFR